MTTGLERITAKARRERKLQFTSLAHHITSELVWDSLCDIPNGSAPGCDGQTVSEAKESFQQWVPEMLRAIHDRGYQPPPGQRQLDFPGVLPQLRWLPACLTVKVTALVRSF